jgi:hypothetical protein
VKGDAKILAQKKAQIHLSGPVIAARNVEDEDARAA